MRVLDVPNSHEFGYILKCWQTFGKAFVRRYMSTVIPNLVSTIIPVYNRAALLREAVQSVLDQTYRPIEIVIVDDESTDDTPDCIRELVAAHPEIIRTARQKNSGPGIARETGRLLAHGEFIQYLDSDDILLPHKFEKQIAALKTQPDAGISYCLTYEVERGTPLVGPPSAKTGERFDHLFPAILNGRIWQTSTPLFRRAISDQAGGWSDLRQEEDWEYDSRFAVLGTKLVWVPEFLAAHLHHNGERAGGNSLRNPTKMRWRYTAHQAVFERAIVYGVPQESTEMQEFARSLFLLSRQCGDAGLAAESKHLFELARAASGVNRASGLDFRLYSLITSIVGWSCAGRVSGIVDRLRRRER